jgi:hypothetical protein
MDPIAEYNARRYCKGCRKETSVHIRVEPLTICVTCSECKSERELLRF